MNNFADRGGGGGVTAKLKNTRNILRSTEFFLICCETATIFSMDSSLSARAVALAAEQARPEAGAGAGLRDSALIGEGEPLGLLPPSVPFFTQFGNLRSEEHTSELQSLMRTSYAVFCLKKKKNKNNHIKDHTKTQGQKN